MNWTSTHGRAVEAAFAALDAAGLDWMVLRNHQGLPHFNRSKDVDLGLDKAMFARAQKVIADALKQLGFERFRVQDFQYARCLTFFRIQDQKPLSVKIDLLDGFVFRGAQVFAFRDLLKRARRDEGFLVPSLLDDAVMLWLKPLVTGGIVKQKYLAEISHAAKNDPEGFKAILDQILTTKWAALAWQRIEANDIFGTIPMKSRLRRSVWLRAFWRAPFATLRDTVDHGLAELRRRAFRPRGTFLAVLGPDGVGKSTFIEGLCTQLSFLQVQDEANIQIQHFRPKLIPNLNQLFTGKVEVVAVINNPHSAPPAGKVSSVLRASYYSLDYILGYWLKFRNKMISGKTIIFDRYVYDFIVDPRRSRLSLPSWAPHLLLLLIPKPDLIYVLDAPAREVYSRKQELPKEEIARQLEEYRKLSRPASERFVHIDASQSPELMVDAAVYSFIIRLHPN